MPNQEDITLTSSKKRSSLKVQEMNRKNSTNSRKATHLQKTSEAVNSDSEAIKTYGGDSNSGVKVSEKSKKSNKDKINAVKQAADQKEAIQNSGDCTLVSTESSDNKPTKRQSINKKVTAKQSIDPEVTIKKRRDQKVTTQQPTDKRGINNQTADYKVTSKQSTNQKVTTIKSTDQKVITKESENQKAIIKQLEDKNVTTKQSADKKATKKQQTNQKAASKQLSADVTHTPRKVIKRKSGESLPNCNAEVKYRKVETGDPHTPTIEPANRTSSARRKEPSSQIPQAIKSITDNKLLGQKTELVKKAKPKKATSENKAESPSSCLKSPMLSSKLKTTKRKLETATSQSLKHEPKPVNKAPLDVKDPMALLMMMEGNSGTGSLIKPSSHRLPVASTSRFTTSESEEDQDQAGNFTSDSEGESERMSDWEEVPDHHAPEKAPVTNGTVEITLEAPDIWKHKKRQKKEFDWKTHLERKVKRFKQEVAEEMHKAHLLCLLALGLRQNEVLNDLTLKGVVLSLLPPQYLVNRKTNVQSRVEALLQWYKQKCSLGNVSHCSNTKLVKTSALIDSFTRGSVTDARVWVLIFIAILRCVGLEVRLVLSYQPMRFKTHQGWDDKKGTKKKRPTKLDGDSEDEPSPKATKKPKEKPSSASKTKSQTNANKGSAPKRKPSRRDSSKQAAMKNKRVLADNDDDDDLDKNDDQEDDYVKQSASDDSDSDFSEKSVKKLKDQKQKQLKKKSSDEDHCSGEFDDNGFCRNNPVNVLKDLKIQSNRKIVSPSTSDDEVAGGKRHGLVGQDVWIEVYFPDSKKWVCLDCFKPQFGKPYALENAATQPVLYVLGFRNNSSVKDVTARYAKQWLTHTRKNRIDQEWWSQTLFLFDDTSYQEHLLEDDEIKSHLLVRPMPTSIAEFKNHPLYALSRHLLKFESIYPETAVPLAYIKKEPVYARECVHVLHSRDNWLKEGRLVRLNEKPYKMVKSRPKWNKPKENPLALDLELYGEWQTEIYIAPPAVNGKVPRNEYGNVELFKPWMLPKGCVQVRGHGLQRVAKKLNIDIAAAMIGWDNHSGYSHPLMDGWIVCEEHADTLMAAWLEDQEIQQQQEQEKKEKRVYGNWRRLIRGLLIRERLHNKFLQKPTPGDISAEIEDKFSDAEEACDAALSWPRHKQDELRQEESKMTQLKVERAKKIVEKSPSSRLIRETEERKDSEQNKDESVGQGADVVSQRNSLYNSLQNIKESVFSDSSSSSEDEISRPKVSNDKKKVSCKKDKDLNFSFGNQIKTKLPAKKPLVKKNKRRHSTDDSEESDYQIKEDTSVRRESLSRHAKSKINFVESESDSEIKDESEVEELVSEDEMLVKEGKGTYNVVHRRNKSKINIVESKSVSEISDESEVEKRISGDEKVLIEKTVSKNNVRRSNKLTANRNVRRKESQKRTKQEESASDEESQKLMKLSGDLSELQPEAESSLSRAVPPPPRLKPAQKPNNNMQSSSKQVGNKVLRTRVTRSRQ